MSSIQKPPTIEICAVCDALDVVVGKFLDARSGIKKEFGKFESTIEALNLFYLSVRHIEGVLCLARTDLVLLPAANACARAALETSAKAAWMVDDNDPFVREARYLAHLREEERVYERSRKLYAEGGHTTKGFDSQLDSIRSFRSGVEKALPSAVAPQKHNPKMDEILLSLGGKLLYPLYVYLSQYVHGGHEATWLYRKNLGSMKEIGEFVEQKDWFIPLRSCWVSLHHPGSLMLRRVGRNPQFFISKEEASHVDAVIEKVK